ncbi:MAG TPA: ABC transporter ATP-binding protein [Magnetospirillaceae bacterium]|nr:ABC transporter ATP-binding protein [Magnetospirillaceae bacterium]
MNYTKETIKFFWQHAWRYPKYVLGIIAALPLTLLVHQFIPPLIAASILDRLAQGTYNPNDWWGSFGSDLLWYAGLSGIGAIFAWRLVVYLSWNLEIKVERDIQRRVFAHLLNLSSNFHANHFGGSLVSQTNKLSSAYVNIADTTIYQTATMMLAYIFTAVILYPRAPLFVVILFALSVAYVVLAVFITRRNTNLNAAIAKAQNKQTGVLADVITNVSAVKSFAAAFTEKQRFGKVTEHTRRTENNLLTVIMRQQSTFASLTWTIGIASLVLGVVGVAVFKADFATVFLILNYTANLTTRLWEFSQQVMRNYNRSFGDARDMLKILNESPEIADPAKPEVPRITKGDITFNNITFAHADTEEALFKNLSLHVSAGRKMGLVGHSGSGKTTLTRLLLRLSNIDSGAITIDGQNIADISQDDLRSHIAYVPQEPLLFHRSLRENIAYGRPNATDEEIFAAARKAHAAEFIEKLPKGYETEVGERGVKLSGGQRQRIAIARAILKDAPILVLDEATSALDSESERLIQAALWELMKGRTAIVIAHRLSTIQRMDEIVVLGDGKIVEQGSHAKLLERGGVYADLWAHQSGGFIEE